MPYTDVSRIQPPALQAGSDTANPHFLEHVVASARQHELEAREDIVSGSGVMLLAKGTRFGAEMRERLLQHKLAGPLEDSVAVLGGVTPMRVAALAEELLERHELLRLLCARMPGDDDALPQALGRLRLAPPVQMLLTVYADQHADRLAHAVGVALLAKGLARRLLPGKPALHRQLALAGLLHDVGELYIDPVHLDRGTQLQPEQWRHIASHPVIGYRVLSKMEGVGPVVAQAVLTHHERLDGFGYPRGLADEALAREDQVLAAAEWLMGLVESGAGALGRASVAAKLIPGEFDPALLELVHAAARQSSEPRVRLQAPPSWEQVRRQIEQVSAWLGTVQDNSAWLDGLAQSAGPELRPILERGKRRFQRIQASFSSAGLDVGAPAQMLALLRATPDARLDEELLALVGEFGWRMRELERESLLRASLLGPDDLRLMQSVSERLGGVPPV